MKRSRPARQGRADRNIAAYRVEFGMNVNLARIPTRYFGREVSATESQVLETVEEIYASSGADENWSKFLKAVIGLVSADSGNIKISHASSKVPITFEVRTSSFSESTGQHVSGVCNTTLVRKRCVRKSSTLSHQSWPIQPDDENGRDVIRPSTLKKIGSRWSLAVRFWCAVDHHIRLAMYWPDAPGRRELELFERLFPHVRRAAATRLLTDLERNRSQQLIDALEQTSKGRIVIDSKGSVIYVSESAREIARQQDGIEILNRRLAFTDCVASRAYRRIVKQLKFPDGKLKETNWRKFSVRRPSGKRPYLVSVHRTISCIGSSSSYRPAAATIRICNPDKHSALDTALLGEAYGLTEAESLLADALDRGCTLREFAEGRDVTISTARCQLYTLMSKLDVKRQVDMVRLFASYR